jgi:molybdate transport system ATP-binding protein
MPSERGLFVRALVPGEAGAPPRLDVMLQAPAGITVVSGPSGAGKSTLLLTIAGLIRPRTGRVTLDGELLFDEATGIFVPPHRRRVALVFQSLALFPHLTAWQNVAYGLAHLPRALRRERALGWLARTRVADLADRSPGTLSGGEAQRVALARALACEPRALLLDEPFSAMDPALRRELRTELLRLVVELDLPTLLVTHEREDAGSITSRVVELGAGRIVAGG